MSSPGCTIRWGSALQDEKLHSDVFAACLLVNGCQCCSCLHTITHHQYQPPFTSGQVRLSSSRFFWQAELSRVARWGCHYLLVHRPMLHVLWLLMRKRKSWQPSADETLLAFSQDYDTFGHRPKIRVASNASCATFQVGCTFTSSQWFPWHSDHILSPGSIRTPHGKLSTKAQKVAPAIKVLCTTMRRIWSWNQLRHQTKWWNELS